MRIFSVIRNISTQNCNSKKYAAEQSLPNQNNKALCSEIDYLGFLGRVNLLNVKQNPENFFIGIEGYGRDKTWAEHMAKITNSAAGMILENKSFSDVTSYIAEEYRNWVKDNVKDEEKICRTGVLRLKDGSVLKTPYNKENRYGAYFDKYEKAAKSGGYFLVKPPEKFPNMAAVHVYHNENGGSLIHYPRGVVNSYKYCSDIYDNLINKYKGKALSKRDIKQVNKQIGSLHWLMAHGTFWKRGSDAITNSFIKSLYAALNFETSPAKAGISFDLEAFCTEYKDFIKKYTQLYSNAPKYIKGIK